MITSGYREHPTTLPGAVLWTSVGAGSSNVLPDGCMDLIWTDEEIIVAGPDLVPYRAERSSRSYVGLRLPPGLLPVLIKIPAADLVNQRVPLADLGLIGRVIPGSHPTRREPPAMLLERLARVLLAEAPSDQLGRATAAGRLIERGHSVTDVADRLGVGARTLHRLSLDWFGYGPKTLARILRLQRALRHAAAPATGAEVAAANGYADQSHLNRDARKITGRSFGELTPRPAMDQLTR